MIEIIVEIFRGIGSLFIRSKTDIDRIERQIEQRQQSERILREQTK